MPKHQLFYEKVNDEIIPFWYVLSFQNHEINWDKYVIFIEYRYPFEYESRSYFDNSIFSYSVRISDLIFSNNSSRFGINLKNIRNKIQLHGLDPMMFQQLIIPLPDINDFLKLIPNKTMRCIN